MPPAPLIASAPTMPPPSVQSPGGVTFTAPDPSGPQISPQEMAATGMAPPSYGYTADQQQLDAPSKGKVASSVAGLMAIVAGIAAIAGSLLQWGKGNYIPANGSALEPITVAGFDSSGIFAAVCGGILIICGILFFVGVPKQLYWAIAAFIGGAVIVGAVVFSLIDIQDLSNRIASEYTAAGIAQTGDQFETQADLGLWIAGAGGVLGVLAAPFVNRS